MGRIEDLAAEMRTAGLTVDDHMLCTIFIDAFPAEYEVEARNLTSRDSIGRDDIIKAVRERHHRRSGNRKKGSSAGHAAHAMYAGGGGGGGRGKSENSGKGKGGKQGKHGRGGRGIIEDGGGSAAAAGGDGSSAKIAEGSTPEVRCCRCGKKDHLKADCASKLCSRCQGRGHTADVCPMSTEKRCNRCNGRGHAVDAYPSSKEEAVLAVSSEVGAMDDDGDDGATYASALKAEETGECSDVLGRKGEGKSAWQVGDEAWLCDSGPSTHMTPTADCMINYRECNLRIAHHRLLNSLDGRIR